MAARAKFKRNDRDYLRRIKDEERAKKQRENEVAELERIEMELISKLQNTQQRQKAAFEGLNQALAKPISPQKTVPEIPEEEGREDDQEGEEAKGEEEQ